MNMTSKLWAMTYMSWFKFILGLMFFELVSILFAIMPDYGNEYIKQVLYGF